MRYGCDTRGQCRQFPHPTRRLTLRDVAQRTGVSPTTASFVLAGREDMRISDAARLRVRRAAADLRYRPNLTARSLRTKVSRTIALLSDTIAGGPYGGAMVPGAPSAALRIPDQLSIVSFDDSDLAGWLRPELTSIALPHYELGRRAVRLLLAGDLGTRTILVPMPVRERESVAPSADRVATGGRV